MEGEYSMSRRRRSTQALKGITPSQAQVGCGLGPGLQVTRWA